MRLNNERAPEQAPNTDQNSSRQRTNPKTSSFSDRAFIGHLSHELRTPMNGVIGMTELLARAPGLSTDFQHLVDDIQQSSGALWEVVSDFLDYAQLESGTLELVEEAFDPHSMVKGAVAHMAANAEQRLLEIAGYVDPGVTHNFTGDFSRMRQALVSLIAAAIKLSRSGEIIVRARHGEATETAATLRLEVEAAGARVPTPKLQRLFEPFTLSDYSVSRRDAGTGLGLAVAQRLVQFMGGSMGVDLGPEDGCTLWMETGLTHRASTQLATTGAQPKLTNKRVLLVGENPRTGALILQQLQDLGLLAQQVSTGGLALDMLKDTKGGADAIDLVIIDRGVQGTDGLAIARSLEAEGLTNDVKLLLLSPFTEQGDPAELQGTAIACELVKPVPADRLATTLDALFSDQPHEERNPGDGGETEPTTSVKTPASVLVAEDNPVNRNLVKFTLEYAGYRVIEVENGQEAFTACKEEEVDLILMDCQMPLVDGCSAAGKIRAWEQELGRGGHIPIIAVTANALEDDRRKCLAAGMDDFLSKPFHHNELFRLLQQWLPPAAQGAEE